MAASAYRVLTDKRVKAQGEGAAVGAVAEAGAGTGAPVTR